MATVTAYAAGWRQWYRIELMARYGRRRGAILRGRLRINALINAGGTAFARAVRQRAFEIQTAANGLVE